MGGVTDVCLVDDMKEQILIASGIGLPANGLGAQPSTPAATGVNIALFVTPSSSCVSGDARNSVLNDGSNPRSSRGDGRAWVDGAPRVAIPHSARDYRLGQEAQRRSTEMAGGDSVVNYAPGSTTTKPLSHRRSIRVELLKTKAAAVLANPVHGAGSRMALPR
jgi:hypothetical protein